MYVFYKYNKCEVSSRLRLNNKNNMCCFYWRHLVHFKINACQHILKAKFKES